VDGKIPPFPPVVAPFNFISLDLIITLGVFGDNNTNLTKALSVGRLYSVNLNPAFSQAKNDMLIKVNNNKEIFFFIIFLIINIKVD
jgi:hypothetical protein